MPSDRAQSQRDESSLEISIASSKYLLKLQTQQFRLKCNQKEKSIWLGWRVKKKGGGFLPTLILPAADMLTTIFILVNVEKVKNITFASTISKPWTCFLKNIYITNAVHEKSDAFAGIRARADRPIYQLNKHPTDD